MNKGVVLSSYGWILQNQSTFIPLRLYNCLYNQDANEYVITNHSDDQISMESMILTLSDKWRIKYRLVWSTGNRFSYGTRGIRLSDVMDYVHYIVTITDV